MAFESCFYRFNLSGIIITGGLNGQWTSTTYIMHELTSVEVLNPDLSPSSCSLPKLPEGIYGHTQTGLTACGGNIYGSFSSSCVTLSGGS